MKSRSDPSTTICVRCLRRRAVIFGGHVTHGRSKIIAGWCVPCARLDERGNNQGWLGHYVKAMR